MKVALIADMVSEYGVSDKLRDLLKTWQGISTIEGRAFILCPEGENLVPRDATEIAFSSHIDRIRATAHMVRKIREFDPDICYIRYDLYMPPAWFLARHYPTVIEINGDDAIELSSRSRWVRYYNLVNRRALVSQATGLIAVTEELRSTEVRKGFHGLTTVIPNGIADASIQQSPSPRNPRRIVFVGYDRPWHGLDRIRLLAQILGDHTFDIVGVAPKPGWPTNVLFHGVLDPDTADSVIASAAVGLGPMAPERKGLRETSALKTRRYLALGVPVILSGRDPDLPGSWFVSQLPDVFEPSKAALQIKEFVATVSGRRVPEDVVRDLIGLTRKEERRARFFSEVLGTAATPSQPSRCGV